jgi:hypothetical protein
LLYPLKAITNRPSAILERSLVTVTLSSLTSFTGAGLISRKKALAVGRTF